MYGGIVYLRDTRHDDSPRRYKTRIALIEEAKQHFLINDAANKHNWD